MHPHYKISRRTEMLPARVHCQFTVNAYLASCIHTTRYHDAHKCFQCRVHVNSQGNHTLHRASTLQDTTSCTEMLSSSRSRQFTVTIHCVMHPHYWISRRTKMLPAREFTSIHELEPYMCVMVPCTTRYHDAHKCFQLANSRQFTSWNHTCACVVPTLVWVPRRTQMLPAREFTSIHELESYLCVMVPCTTRYHDAQKCFQLANSRRFTSWNHTCASCVHTTSVPHTHTHASSSRSLSIHSNHTLRHASTLQDTTHAYTCCPARGHFNSQ